MSTKAVVLHDNGVVDLLLERNGWQRHGESVVMNRGEQVVVLMLVEYDIDEQVDRRPWWPVEPRGITGEPELSLRAA